MTHLHGLRAPYPISSSSPSALLAVPAEIRSPRRAAYASYAALATLSLSVMLAGCGGGSDDPVASAPAAQGGSNTSNTKVSPAPAPAPVAASPSPIAAPAAAPVAAAPAVAQEAGVPSEQAAAASRVQLRGVNLSGAEFGADKLPGRAGYDYIYPAQTSVTYFKGKGMNFVRLPFLWERLQPTLNGALDAAELARLKEFVAGSTAKGMTVLIDPHNYAHYRGGVIGSSAVPAAAYGDFWARLAGEFKGNSKVMFGLMNEPYDITTENWVTGANEAIRRIRQAGAANTIAVPGNAWSGAHSWFANWYGTPNAQAMLKIVDSGNNMVFEVHQYLDADSSGTSATCTSATAGVERVKAFTAWLKTNKKRALLGEFAGADNATCKTAVAGMLKHLDDNRDVWAGWTYWAAGPWWGADMFSIEPASPSVDKPLMKTLLQFLL